jgi:hypothetical protein
MERRKFCFLAKVSCFVFVSDPRKRKQLLVRFKLVSCSSFCCFSVPRSVLFFLSKRQRYQKQNGQGQNANAHLAHQALKSSKLLSNDFLTLTYDQLLKSMPQINNYYYLKLKQILKQSTNILFSHAVKLSINFKLIHFCQGLSECFENIILLKMNMFYYH